MTKCWTNAFCATWWPNLQLMQVAPPVEQICNHCKYLHVVANIWKQWMRLHMAKLSSCKWQVAPSSGQICNQFKWCQVMVKFRTDPSGEFWTNTSGAAYNWPNLEPMQVAFYLDGEITQVKETIPWVCCVSGNVFLVNLIAAPEANEDHKIWNWLGCVSALMKCASFTKHHNPWLPQFGWLLWTKLCVS